MKMDANLEHKLSAYNATRREHWDNVARQRSDLSPLREYYHERLAEVYAQVVPQGLRVLELGCATGDLLAGLKPSRGVGVDFSGEMLAQARSKHPQIEFIQADVHDVHLDETFDVIILSDIINDLYDVQQALQNVGRFCHAKTRVVLNFFSVIWKYPLRLAEKMGLKQPVLEQSWLSPADVKGLMELADFEPLRCWQEVLSPVRVPVLSALCNRYLVKTWPLQHLALTSFLVARPKGLEREEGRTPSVTVVVPARNEAGNIENIFRRTPQMGAFTELIFVEGHSTDNTAQAIEQAIARHPEVRASFFRQPGKGKADAVRVGFDHAVGDILMILDADLTVPPETLPRFVEALASGHGEFVNGVRLVYPLEKESMRLANLFGNKFFSLAFSWLLGQRIKDTLCGTKVLWRTDYQNIAADRAYFGDFDPFGDFDLLFGAARKNLKFVEIPIRYLERTYGDTNIQRWRHGLILLRMVLFAARRIKFI